ncbi:uncharacterized protein LOC131978650 [Centropristis striata]|uniref:uncharacterized protein LOC131978650 n=1 Tax=Centropristis striata TaxID=184440 RepID=UPI0027DF881A|nr:uncharacterized protein LOC131978650 [Centropristis striata]
MLQADERKWKQCDRCCRHADMMAGSFNIFIISTVCLSFIVPASHGFQVIQPPTRTVNPDGSATISCELAGDVSSLQDVRLNSLISPTDNPRLLCQKGKRFCPNVTMYEESPNKWIFVLLHIGPEALNMKYQCEFSVTQHDLDEKKTGTTLTTLLPGEKGAVCILPTPPPPPAPPAPPAPESQLLRWIPIALLALTLLYSCIITFFYMRLRCSATDPENSTYVEMRKAPRPRVPPQDIYCG